MRILGSNPVLAVHDLDTSASWFRDVLDCECFDPDPGNWTFCRSGEVVFMLGRCPDEVPAAEIGNHSYLAYLRVDDLDAFHARVVEAEVEIVKPLTEEPWGMRELGIRSPDGHRFMLAEPASS